MGYFLEATIGDEMSVRELQSKDKASLLKVSLDFGLTMVPLTSENINLLSGGEKVITKFGAFEALSDDLCLHLIQVSEGGRLGYCEAEFFGGEGSQSSIVFSNSKEVFRLNSDLGAINKMLSFLGVMPRDNKDEF